MAATIKDIARKVGVAPSTVSRVLANKSHFYGSETAEKVRQAAQELGYKKNRAAVELVKQSSNVIAAVVSSVKTNFAGQMLDGIQSEAAKHGLNLVIVYSNSTDPKEQRQALLTVIERPVRGILLLSIALSEDNLALLQESQVPFCFVSMSFGDQRPFISSDDTQIGYTATKLLLANGHRKIGLAAIDKYPFTGQRRLDGYRKALAEAGVQADPAWVKLGDYSYDAGVQAMQAYGAETELTAVVAGSDMAAIGVLNQARNFGRRVPEELSIVSIDGTEMCQIVQPKLTSVSQDFYQMGVVGVQRIQALSTAKVVKPTQQQFIPTKVVERESVQKI